MHTDIHIFLCVDMHACIHMYRSIHTSERAHTHICIRVHVHICTRIYIYIHTQPSHACMHACMRLHIYKHTYLHIDSHSSKYMAHIEQQLEIIQVYTHTHMYIYIHITSSGTWQLWVRISRCRRFCRFRWIVQYTQRMTRLGKQGMCAVSSTTTPVRELAALFSKQLLWLAMSVQAPADQHVKSWRKCAVEFW